MGAATDGIKRTLSVHVPPGESVAPRQPSLVTTKSSPPTATVVMVSGSVPTFVTVTWLGALTLPPG